MKKTLLFALPFAALMLAVACKKHEAAVAPEQPVAAATLPAAKPVVQKPIEQKPVAAKPVAKNGK